MRSLRVQRNIATLIAAFGFSAFIVNLTLGLTLRGETFLEAMSFPSLYHPLIAAILYFSTRKIDHISVRIFHVAGIVFVAAFAILDSYRSFFGLGFMTLTALLSYKYGFLDRGYRWKLGIGLAMVIVLVEVSVYRAGSHLSGVGIAVILFLIFFTMFLFFIYRDDLENLESKNRRLTQSLSELIAERSKIEKDMQDTNRRLESYEDKIQDLMSDARSRIDEFQSQYSLTRKELEITIIMYETGKSNREIAEDLGISEGTVKQHLSRIYSKVDVRNRAQILTTMRDYLP
jgi:DNA-binding CsgD family transcriptional regulator